MNVDLNLSVDENNLYDIQFASNGDFLMDDGLDTSILMSIFCEVRADISEVITPQFRRGDWSNELNDVVDYEVGSKLWLLDQARANQVSLNLGIDTINDGLQWLLDDNIVKEIDVDGEIINNTLFFTVNLTQKNDQISTYRFDQFKETGE